MSNSILIHRWRTRFFCKFIFYLFIKSERVAASAFVSHHVKMDKTSVGLPLVEHGIWLVKKLKMDNFRREGLFGAHQVQRFNRDIDETLAWIGEKDATLSSDDYGRDLNNVQALQRKHEGTERDLAALDAKVNHRAIFVLVTWLVGSVTFKSDL